MALQSPANSPDRLADLVQQLGDSEFALREQAEAALLQAGAEALPPLRAAANWSTTRDHEVQLRAERLLELLGQQQRERQIEIFIAGQGSLPGWDRYQRRLSGTPEHRQLYAGMYRAAPGLLERLESSEDVVAELETMLPGIYPRVASDPQRALSQLAAALFAGLEHVPAADSGQATRPGRLTDSQLTTLTSQLNRSGIVREIKRSQQKGPLLELAAAWVSAIPQRAPFYQQKIRCLETINDPLLTPALNQLLQDRSLPPSLRALSVLALSQLEGNTGNETLESLLSDPQTVGRFLVSNADNATDPGTLVLEVQIRDLCLLARLIHASIPPGEFGFRPDAIDGGQINIKRAGFATDLQRQQAMRRAASLF